MPESPNAWNSLSIFDWDSDSDAPLRQIRRARVLSPGVPLYALHETMMLMSMGRREEARGVAAELLSSGGASAPGAASADPRLVSGEYVLAQVEASEGRFGAAFARARRVLLEQPVFGSLMTNDLYMATLLLDLGVLLGRAPEVAEEFVRVFVDPDPPRLHPGRFVAARVASVCARAPRAAARRCFERVRALDAAGYFREPTLPTSAPFIKGAEAYSRGDWAAAVAAWRPLLPTPGTQGRNLLPEAFERAGEPELAERIDKGNLGMEGPFHGVGLAHLRAAKRALARGDRERAEALGRRVIDAWSTADVPVPAIAELKALLGDRPAVKAGSRGPAR
jgi:hypothetical protein